MILTRLMITLARFGGCEAVNVPAATDREDRVYLTAEASAEY